MQTNESVLVFDGVPKTYVIEEESSKLFDASKVLFRI